MVDTDLMSGPLEGNKDLTWVLMIKDALRADQTLDIVPGHEQSDAASWTLWNERGRTTNGKDVKVE